MPRKPLEKSCSLPYHVTARTNNRESFHLRLEKFWDLMGVECLNLAWVYGVKVHALVLMPNHFHLMLTVPEHDLGKVMNVLISSVTRTSNLMSGRLGHVFGGPYHWSLINSPRYYGHALKYVYRNPVRARLCSKVEDYPFSTLQGLLGQAPSLFPICHTRVQAETALPSAEAWAQLDWLNTPFSSESESLIQQGLRKKLFAAIVERRTRRPSEELGLLL